jgi:hypothetical protein
MTKIVIIPVNSTDEISMFEKTVILGINSNSLQPLLFIKLYELLQSIHGDGPFPIWGVASGEKSSEANKWNRIEDNDVVLFARSNKILGYAIVKTKFQSENVARELWPDLHTSEIRQYLFTLEKYVEIDDRSNRLLEPIVRRGKFQLDSFQLIDNQFSLELIKAIGLDEIEVASVSSGQGFGLTAAEKKVVELHAVKLAIEHLTMLGYTEIEDVGDKESFDLRALSSEKQINVEVKGSTGAASSVILTKNEVSFQKDAYPLNGLFVVSNIELTRGEKISAQGGDIQFISPWLIDESSLNAISYQYQI